MIYLARLKKLSRQGRRLRVGAMKYLWKHPPRGAAPYAAEASTPLDESIAHLTGSTVYGLECPCGAKELRADVGQIAGGFIGPLHVSCAQCKESRTIFSRHLHGREAEMGRRPDERDDSDILDREDGVSDVELACPKCKRDLLELAVRFDYGETPPEQGERRQEFFRSFSAYARCPSCERAYRIGDVETA